jgi:hypothetical protein
MINFFIAALVATCIGGVCQLFLHQERQRKIASLAIAYASFLMVIALLCLEDKAFFEITSILINLTIIFAANLFIGSRLLKNAGAENAIM